jgi:hypothetical protein
MWDPTNLTWALIAIKNLISQNKLSFRCLHNQNELYFPRAHPTILNHNAGAGKIYIERQMELLKGL